MNPAERLRALLEKTLTPVDRLEADALINALATAAHREVRHRQAVTAAEISLAGLKWRLYGEEFGERARVRSCARAWHLSDGISERRARHLLAIALSGRDYLYAMPPGAPKSPHQIEASL